MHFRALFNEAVVSSPKRRPTLIGFLASFFIWWLNGVLRFWFILFT